MNSNENLCVWLKLETSRVIILTVHVLKKIFYKNIYNVISQFLHLFFCISSVFESAQSKKIIFLQRIGFSTFTHSLGILRTSSNFPSRELGSGTFIYSQRWNKTNIYIHIDTEIFNHFKEKIINKIFEWSFI